MVEFAIAFPFLIVLAVSIVDYGHYLETANNLATVVRDGTRYASENTTGTTAPLERGLPGTELERVQRDVDVPEDLVRHHHHGLDTTAGGPYTQLKVSGFSVALASGASLFIGGPTGPAVTLSAAAAAGATTLSIVSWPPTSNYPSNTPVDWLPPSNTVEGVIQAEAESLTVPEGGLTLASTDCTWSGSATPPAGPAGADPASPGCPHGRARPVA